MNDFACQRCRVVIRDTSPLGTTPDGVVGAGNDHGLLTGHVAVDPEHHFALNWPEGVRPPEGGFDLDTLVAEPDSLLDRAAWLRFFIQRDIDREIERATAA